MKELPTHPAEIQYHISDLGVYLWEPRVRRKKTREILKFEVRLSDELMVPGIIQYLSAHDAWRGDFAHNSYTFCGTSPPQAHYRDAVKWLLLAMKL